MRVDHGGWRERMATVMLAGVVGVVILEGGREITMVLLSEIGGKVASTGKTGGCSCMYVSINNLH